MREQLRRLDFSADSQARMAATAFNLTTQSIYFHPNRGARARLSPVRRSRLRPFLTR